MKPSNCVRCGHSPDVHSHDDVNDNHLATDPACPFRCNECDCPDYIGGPLLGLATTGHLLDELDARNEVGQCHRHANNGEQAAELIRKLRVAFSLRNGGLDYRTVDE